MKVAYLGQGPRQEKLTLPGRERQRDHAKVLIRGMIVGKALEGPANLNANFMPAG